jgi:hypothetical protein
MTRALRRTLALALVLIGFALPGAASADAAQDALTAEQIYARVLENRFSSFSQEARMASGDRVGRVQETRFNLIFKDFRDADKKPVRGVLSKTMVKYTYPFDLRHSGYLVIQNRERIDDHFVYLPTRRQTVRVNLRGEAVLGTDFSFEDVIPRDIADANYKRLDDAVVDDAPVFVIESHPSASFDSEYTKFVFYVDKRSFVPLRTRYWDHAGIEVKELRTRPWHVQEFDGVYVPMKLTMRNLLLETYTTLEVMQLAPNAKLPDEVFEVRRLETH